MPTLMFRCFKHDRPKILTSELKKKRKLNNFDKNFRIFVFKLQFEMLKDLLPNIFIMFYFPSLFFSCKNLPELMLNNKK